MKLGFVGVGKHAQRMAKAFRECGAEIVAYDRAVLPDTLDVLRRPADGFGRRMDWLAMVRSGDIDGIVCCTPPEVTTQVVMCCAEARKRVCASKPLMVTPYRPSDEVYVDLWRLYSPAWLALKSELAGKTIQSVHVDFYGSGPFRTTHSGLLDYGPHALAFLLDLGLPVDGLEWEHRAALCQDRPDKFWFGVDDARNIHVATGNEASEPSMQVHIDLADGTMARWGEKVDEQVFGITRPSYVSMQHSRDLALRAFCRAFLAGEPSDTLRISCEAMRVLTEVESGTELASRRP